MGRRPGNLWDKLFYPSFGYSSKFHHFNIKTEKFISDLTDDSWAIQWPYELPEISHIAYAKLKLISKFRNVHAWPEINYHLSSGNRFIELARGYVKDLLVDSLNNDGCHTVVTHNMLEPCNPESGFCFFDNIKSIVVDRDPRDIYMTASTYSLGFNDAVPIYSRISGAFDIDLFIKRQRILRDKTDYSSNDNVLRIRFEDLVFNYSEICKIIYKFLEIPEGDHKFKMRAFNPEDSIKNIGLWKGAPNELKSHILKIQKELPELCYF